MVKYVPETQQQKRERLVSTAAQETAGQRVAGGKPKVLKFGLNHVTTLIEQKKAKLVVIANDVDPIELVVWMPALCRKMGVPYCIVKNKARLGTLVHQKTASCVALTDLRKENQHDLSLVVEQCQLMYNEQTSMRKGGGIMGFKTQQSVQKLQAKQARDLASKSQ